MDPMATTPDLRSYDIVLVNSSAGKDSQAMLDYLVGLADEQGASRDRFVVVHCDLGRVEWEGTVELAAEQAAHYGLRFEVVQRDLGDLLTQVEQRHEANIANGRDIAPWPSSNARWCTSDQKTSQVKKLVTSLVRDYRPFPNSPSTILGRKVRILNCLGIRAQESSARAQKIAFGPDEMNWTKTKKDGVTVTKPHGKREVDRWLPIFAWSEEQVWDRIHASGVRYHDAYEKGMSRLSCAFCVLASRGDLLIAARHNKGLAQEYLAVEVKVGKRFTNDLSMADIIAAAERAEKVSA
jgi:3'-phosphoadenosine 5'-phosphosulfate sulfotransferase (PAPS reductase)/FAD synthetase